MKKILWLIAIATVVLTFGVMPVMAAPKGKIVVAFDTDTPTMDPHGHVERAGLIINWHLFDSLFFRQKDMKVVPGLIKSYTVINDVTVDLDLRDDVKFHSGEPFTAESVKFSMERVLDPAGKSPRITSINWLQSAEILSDYKVRLHFKKPYPLWMEEMQNFAMVPPKYIQEKGKEYFAEHPVGTGPYKFVKWSRGEEIVLEANKDYFKGVPRIKTVIFKIIPDFSTQIAALLSGAVDVVRNITPEDRTVIDAKNNLKTISLPILRFQWFYFADALNPDSPLSDKRVRQAINYAVNIPRIINDIVGGFGTQNVSLNPMHFGYNPDVKPYPYDPEKAKVLLKEAGYDASQELTFNYAIVNMIKADEVVQSLQSDLAQVGVKIKLQKWSGVGYMDLVKSGRAGPIFGLNWGSNGVFDGDAILYPFFHSTQQYSFFHTEELDKLIMEQHTMMDQEKRKEIMGKIQAIIKEEAPWIFMYAFHSIKAFNAKFDFQPRSDETFYAYEIGFKE